MSAAIRRQLGCGPSGHYDIAGQTQTIIRKPKPERKTRLIGGLWMTNDGDGWRFATPEEIEGLAD